MTPEQISGIQKLPLRQRDAHKGNFGRILIIGGSRSMVGAPALTANSALRAGAGLVTMALPEIIQQSAASLAPCATSLVLPCDQDSGFISEYGVHILSREIISEKNFDVIAIGPGLGEAMAVNRLIPKIVDADIPVVIDADGLNNLSRINWPGLLAGRCIITPHPGELARLLNRPAREIQTDRQACVVEAVDLMTRDEPERPAVCLLKGAQTVACDGQRVYVNETGNPGMASGGAGDVLTGTIAALLGQGLDTFDSACLGAYVHGLAGDLAANDLTEISLTATDLIDYLPQAFKQVQQLG